MSGLPKIYYVLPVLCLLVTGCVQQSAPKQQPATVSPAPLVQPQPQKEKQADRAEKKEKHSKKPTLPRQVDKNNKVKPTVMGWVEKVNLSGSSHTVKAKLDSGAKTSSVDAEIVKIYKRDGKKFVLYRVMLDDAITETYESRLLRWVRIKDKTGGYIRRPVVKMQFTMGKKTIRGEVSLAERGHMIYPVLIGRNMLEGGNILVDTSRTFVTDPNYKR